MKKGFTLVEVMVVVAVIAVLAAIIIPTMTKQNSGTPSQTPSETPRTVVIDGCQYLEVDRGISRTHIYSLTHKGNCTNHYLNGKIEKE